jgi:cation transport regulator ChaC
LTIPGLKVVTHPDQAQFSIYEVPQQIAARFDCASRLIPGSVTNQPSAAGDHFGTVFRIAGSRKDASIALLWAKENGYWKIVSWQAEPEPDRTPAPPALPQPEVVRIKADLTLVQAAKSFVENWLIRKDYDTAFRYLPTRSYGCYDLVRGPDAPPSTSVDDAGRKLRGSLERIGQWVGTTGRLETIIEAAEPRHASIQVMDQPYSRMFSVTSFPTALGAVVECDARARAAVPPDPLPLEYGEAFGMTFRFRTQEGDAPVLRLLWRRENNNWRVTAYDVDLP